MRDRVPGLIVQAYGACEILGGSWVVRSVTGSLSKVIILVILLLTVLQTTHEPPSM